MKKLGLLLAFFGLAGCLTDPEQTPVNPTPSVVYFKPVVTAPTGGSVVVKPDSAAKYDSIKIFAVADSGYKFDGWTGACAQYTSTSCRLIAGLDSLKVSPKFTKIQTQANVVDTPKVVYKDSVAKVKVTDSVVGSLTGDKVKGVIVKLKNLGLVTKTDEKGNYKFTQTRLVDTTIKVKVAGRVAADVVPLNDVVQFLYDDSTVFAEDTIQNWNHILPENYIIQRNISGIIPSKYRRFVDSAGFKIECVFVDSSKIVTIPNVGQTNLLKSTGRYSTYIYRVRGQKVDSITVFIRLSYGGKIIGRTKWIQFDNNGFVGDISDFQDSTTYKWFNIDQPLLPEPAKSDSVKKGQNLLSVDTNYTNGRKEIVLYDSLKNYDPYNFKSGMVSTIDGLKIGDSVYIYFETDFSDSLKTKFIKDAISAKWMKMSDDGKFGISSVKITEMNGVWMDFSINGEFRPTLVVYIHKEN